MVARGSCLSLEASFQPSSCTSMYCMGERRAPVSTPVVNLKRFCIATCCILLLGFRTGDDARRIYTWETSNVVLSSHHSIEQNSKHGSQLARNAPCESFASPIAFQSNDPFSRRLTSLSTDIFPGHLAPEMPRAIFAACLGHTNQI
jgi:hypothetical protein